MRHYCLISSISSFHTGISFKTSNPIFLKLGHHYLQIDVGSVDMHSDFISKLQNCRSCTTLAWTVDWINGIHNVSTFDWTGSHSSLVFQIVLLVSVCIQFCKNTHQDLFQLICNQKARDVKRDLSIKQFNKRWLNIVMTVNKCTSARKSPEQPTWKRATSIASFCMTDDKTWWKPWCQSKIITQVPLFWNCLVAINGLFEQFNSE